jgi:hypothetical protein
VPHRAKVLTGRFMKWEVRGRVSWVKRTSWVLLASLWTLNAAVASAAPSETDRSVAQSLFEEGKRLMSAGKHAEACPKLEESQRLDPGGGTLLNLALCHELSGKIATAWAEFNEALSLARRDGRQDRIKAAQEHIAALAPKLPALTLVVSSPAEGQELRMDGAVVGRAAWGTPLSVDPGSHELRVKAPGKKEWTSTVTIGVGEKRTLSVPELETAEGPTTEGGVAPRAGHREPGVPDETPAKSAPASNARRTAGWVVGGVGVVALGVGGYFGLQAFAKRKDSNELCPTDTTCSGPGVTYNQEAYTNAWVSNIGIGVGVVGVAVGTYLILSSGGAEQNASRAPRSRWDLAAVALPGGGELRARGTW